MEKGLAMLTIGELAKRADTNAVTIRYYEKRGLIAVSERSEGGHRLYPETLMPRLLFILNAKLVGFSLEEIHTLLELQQHKSSSSRLIKQMVLDKMRVIDEKIVALEDIKQLLTELSCQCDGTKTIEECPILEALQTSSFTHSKDFAPISVSKFNRTLSKRTDRQNQLTTNNK